jgi:16S rRNA C967 or C1407 C5-methylase (RsmB/RsmF family)
MATPEDSQDETPIIKLFDYVLVDAECSTDGSLKHVKERIKESSTKKETNWMFTDQAQLADLVALQKRLIASGFRLLKPGGTMVYSTCSLSQDQNENLVQWLLDNTHDAVLIPVHFPLAKSKLVVEGSLHGTVRFYPNLGQASSDYFGDGFFLAKIGRLQPKKPDE